MEFRQADRVLTSVRYSAPASVSGDIPTLFLKLVPTSRIGSKAMRSAERHRILLRKCIKGGGVSRFSIGDDANTADRALLGDSANAAFRWRGAIYKRAAARRAFADCCGAGTRTRRSWRATHFSSLFPHSPLSSRPVKDQPGSSGLTEVVDDRERPLLRGMISDGVTPNTVIALDGGTDAEQHSRNKKGCRALIVK